MINQTVVRVTSETYADFLAAIDGPVQSLPAKAIERFGRIVSAA